MLSLYSVWLLNYLHIPSCYYIIFVVSLESLLLLYSIWLLYYLCILSGAHIIFVLPLINVIQYLYISAGYCITVQNLCIPSGYCITFLFPLVGYCIIFVFPLLIILSLWSPCLANTRYLPHPGLSPGLPLHSRAPALPSLHEPQQTLLLPCPPQHTSEQRLAWST